MLRETWHMPGFVRCDMLAIAMLHTAHYTAATRQEALEKAVKAQGCHSQQSVLILQRLYQGGISHLTAFLLPPECMDYFVRDALSILNRCY